MAWRARHGKGDKNMDEERIREIVRDEIKKFVGYFVSASVEKMYSAIEEVADIYGYSLSIKSIQNRKPKK